MTTSFAPTAVAISSCAHARQRVEDLGRVRHEPRRLLDGPPFVLSRSDRGSILTLVASNNPNTWDVFKLYHALELPRCRIPWVLVQEVAVRLNLFVVHLSHEPDVRAGSDVSATYGSFVLTLAEIQILPSREVRAHRRADKEHRSLLSLHPACFLSLVLLTEIPRLTVIGINHGKIKRKPRREVTEPASFDLMGYSRR